MVCQLVFQRQDTSSGHAENHMTMVDPCLIHPLLPVLVLVELVNQGLHLLLIPGTEGQKDLSVDQGFPVLAVVLEIEKKKQRKKRTSRVNPMIKGS